MASFYEDVEAEWRDDGIDRAPRADALAGPADDAIAKGERTAVGRLELRRMLPLAIFLAGVLIGKAL